MVLRCAILAFGYAVSPRDVASQPERRVRPAFGGLPVPGLCCHEAMSSGYAATPQSGKLGIKPGMRVGLERPPAGWALTDPPPISTAQTGPADLIVWFVPAARELGRAAELGRRIFPAGALWVAWPRRAAGHESDVTENEIRAAALPLGLVDVKVAAIDANWSGLKLVWRKELRDHSAGMA